MGTASVLLDVMDALNTRIAADTAITSLCTVYDGPPIVDRSSDVEMFLGATGLDADDDGTTLTRTVTSFGGGPAGALRQEVVSTHCAIWAIGGETTTAERRAQVRAVFNAVCANLSAGSGDLGLGAVLCGGVEVREGTLRQVQTNDGFAVILTFTVIAEAQI